MREQLEAFVRWVMRDVTYHRVYAAAVERDNGDGTVDLQPDDAAMRGLGLQRVPVRVGIAATTLRVEPGTRCLFGFEAGDPRRPYVAAWPFQQGSAVVELDGGQAGVARKGDLVDVLLTGAPTGTPVTGFAIGTVGAPPVPLPLPPSPAALFVGTIVVPSEVRGVIIGGAPRVKA